MIETYSYVTVEVIYRVEGAVTLQAARDLTAAHLQTASVPRPGLTWEVRTAVKSGPLLQKEVVLKYYPNLLDGGNTFGERVLCFTDGMRA